MSVVPRAPDAVAHREELPLPPRDIRGRFTRRPSAATLPRTAWHRLPVLFVVSEMADYIKAGGLGDVAAALPRAMRPGSDVRVLIPGYPEVLQRIDRMSIVGQVPAHAGLPACRLGLAHQPDGLPVYVLLNPALFERGGSPYVDGSGAEWDDNAIRFATFAHAAARIAAGDCGVLALPLDAARDEWLLFFRCEQVEDVRWAGRPDQPLVIDAEGGRIGPRASFASWQETVRGTSAPWSDADLRMAGRLRLTLREHYRQPGRPPGVGDLHGRRSRLDVGEQRKRLVQLSELLGGLVHANPGETAQLAARIAQLESDLQSLISAAGATTK